MHPHFRKNNFNNKLTLGSVDNMKKSIILAIPAALLLAGCVSTTYTKSVSVTKDAQGNIIGTVEHEGVTQPNQQGWPVEFKYLKGVRTNEVNPQQK
jgi:hypothetical protein